MASRRARRARAAAAATERTAAAGRITQARSEIEHRALVAAAEPYRGELPLFHATALSLGLVPDPAPVPDGALAEQTRLLPVVKPGSLLGLLDETSGESR